MSLDLDETRLITCLKSNIVAAVLHDLVFNFLWLIIRNYFLSKIKWKIIYAWRNFIKYRPCILLSTVLNSVLLTSITTEYNRKSNLNPRRIHVGKFHFRFEGENYFKSWESSLIKSIIFLKASYNFKNYDSFFYTLNFLHI